VNFFNALLAHLGITDVQVDQYGGKHKIRPGLKAITERSGFSQVASLAVTRDADFADDPADDALASQRAFQSVRDALIHAGLPATLDVKASGTPQVSVFILPDNNNPGMLEDLCIASMSQPEIACIDEFFNCIAAGTARAQIRRNVSKSRVHAWLATQAEPDKRLGEAAKDSYINWNHPAFDPLKQFLQQL
jgi:hypothetical protein